jgi:hypothetical protein
LLGSLRRGLLLGGAILIVVLPTVWSCHHTPAKKVSQPPGVASQPLTRPIRLADFAGQKPAPEVRKFADWVVDSGDHGTRAFVLVDKVGARVYVFDPSGRLKQSAPALLGAATGDDSAPGIGDKPLSQVKPEEKTTPAGRFIAEPGTNTQGEDIVWVDYELAVSMHRVRPAVKAERRLERLASPTPTDNRISFGCINLPPRFYERTLRPVVVKTGAVIYVLPETRSPVQQFTSYYDVELRAKQLAHRVDAPEASTSRSAAVSR